ncbi:MAG TPA: OsmC family protein [Caulobacteraceae bacterium]|nr:OsmC family protein [Caulobacteraceae bacterium]
MSLHHATVEWAWDGGDFPKRRYSRLHTLDFGHGVTAPGSPATAIVPAPFSSEAAIDPESAFVASLSACHMLWFLDLAAGAGWVVKRYRDEAEGTLGRIAPGKMAMTRVALRPQIAFEGRAPDAAELERLHHEAHARCFIANSVTTEVVVEPA